jgi:hypothetical protein
MTRHVGGRAESLTHVSGIRRKLCDRNKPRGVGAGGRSRTLDLRITNALLYQLSYTGPDQARAAIIVCGRIPANDARNGATVN